ncbi:HAD-IA family hydrolase [Anaerobiospirillum sp. NML120449]|uniref:HAD family hydrolase n=1 Tax=Anaerobiospirillum sp. NML120449 TaxID=2932817 RepID=UPI001FF2D04F|nr:HAD-IA family hydrolase [Anaerobiospirillum sp. NML120449]MCK0526238.1 HAD-IA family hydrolase [Anaerobiospirillum sp. NML120449]
MIDVDFSPYQGLIFDLDGTLIDSMPYHIQAWQQTAKEHGFSIEPEFICERGGFSSRNIVLAMADAGHDVGDVSEFVRRKVELYRSWINKVPLFPRAFDILKTARERGAKIGIGTGTQRINVVDILEIHNISDMIDFIVSADDVTRHKPDPQTYLELMEMMKLTAEKILVVEDGLPGIQAAAAASMDCLVVDNDKFIRLDRPQRS